VPISNRESADSSSLRARAEAFLRASRAKGDDRRPHEWDDAATLVHELAVHQVELELQNEELRRTQLELERSQARHQHLLQHAPLPFFFVTNAGEVTAFNEAAETTFGSLVHTGASITTFFHRDDTDEFERARLAMERTGLARQCRVRRHPGHGEDQHLQAYLQPTEEAELGRGYLLALVDITAEHTLHVTLAQTDRLTNMGQLAASVAHEVNNPLTYLVGELGFLDDDLVAASGAPGVETARARVARLRDGIERIGTIARSLTSFARFDVDDPDERVDLVEAARHALMLVRNEMRFRCRLEVELEPVPLARGSEAAFAQVFLNLLINALHALPRHSSTDNRVTVRTWTEAGRACAEVADTGKGIPDEIQRKVFEPFFTTRAVGEGTGLGLAIVRRTIEERGGTLSLTSQVGMGTSVRFELPSTSRPRTAPSTGVTAEPGGRFRVLVVDDEPMILTMLQRYLGQHHDVVTAPNGLEALKILERDEAFDMVLCDVAMPGLSGVELHEWMSQRGSRLARRTAFMTGGVSDPDLQRYLEGSGCPMLSKPFDRSAVLRVVGEQAEGRGEG